MPLPKRCECSQCGQGNLFRVARLRANGQLLLVCDECGAAWAALGIDHATPGRPRGW
jgi:hypothetical protein